MFYLILANLYLAVFFAFYWVALRNQTFFRWNRACLLGGLVLAFVLPALDISAWYAYPNAYPQYLIGNGEPVVVEAGAVDVSQPESLDWKKLLVAIYAIGCAISFLFFLLRMERTLHRLRTFRPGAAFSFFGAIRVDKNLVGYEQIEAHEKVHAKEWHSVDLIVMQLVKIVNWFNPIVYCYEHALRMQHEYIADGITADGDKLGYAELLVARAMGVEPVVLSHTFSNKRWLKRRVSMLLRDKSRTRSLLRYALLLPVIGILGVFSIACNQQQSNGRQPSLSVEPVADTVGGLVSVAENIKLFSEQIGKNVPYAQEAIRDKKQGALAFTFEKAENGHIEHIKFLNELWEGQQEQVLRVLQSKRVDSLAPIGKYLATIEFRLSGKGGMSDEMLPPPPPVPAEYTILSPIVIVGFPPKVTRRSEPKSTRAGQNAKQNEEAKTILKDAVSGNQVFQSVEVNPEPQGGMRAFMEYIAKNYDYPQEAIEAEINGKLLVSFIVEKDGSLTDIRLIEDLGYGTGDAALRVVRNGQKWSPGIQNGQPVRVAYTLPIRLNLQQ
ncbi:M56 family metallopeptidase [Parapedobacter defluvii]|uniref:M56 family metallopeptidase n=1 Tax=Parapedobacter defluvii TaxID=2045106 RepID=UPI0033428046